VAILSGLAESAQQAIAATIDAIRLRNPSVGLTGRVERNGRRRPLSSLGRVEQQAGAGLEAQSLFVSSPEVDSYLEVAKSAERAIGLSAAELRGADQRGEEIDRQQEELTQSLAETSTAVVDSDERSVLLAAIDEVVLPVEVVQDLQDAVDKLYADPQRTTLLGALEQAEAAKSRLLPGDGNQAALLADLAIAEADGSIAAYDVIPGGAASALHDQLAKHGMADTPDQAPAIAERVIAESIELRQMRHTLSRELGEGTDHAPIDHADSLVDMRRNLERSRLGIQRRLRAQQRLLAIAQQTIAELQGFGDSARAEGDLSPLLIEEPLHDLPGSLNGAVLSMLLRHSAHRQIICISNQQLLEKWVQSVPGRAGWSQSSGWFLNKA